MVVRFFSLFLILFCFGWAMEETLAHFLSQVHCATENNSTLNRDSDPALGQIYRALAKDSRNFELYSKLGRIYLRMTYGREEGIFAMQATDNAIEAYEKAVQFNPFRAEAWYALGRTCKKKYLLGGRNASDWVNRADLSMEMAVMMCPNSTELLRLVGEYWVWRASVLPAKDEAARVIDTKVPLTAFCKISRLSNYMPKNQAQGIERFQSLFQHALSFRKGRRDWKRIVNYVLRVFDEENIVKGIMPDSDKWVRKKVNSYLNSL